MRRFVIPALLALAVPFVALADDKKPVTKDEKKDEKKDVKAPNMYPLEKGTKWEYEISVNGMTLSIVQEVTDVAKPEKKGERAVATVTTEVNGMTITEEISVDDKGIYKHSFNNMKLEKPMLAFKYPAKEQKWTEKIKIADQDAEAKMEMKEAEELKVPAGTYKKAVPVMVTMSVMGQDIEATSYYVDGVGIVKQEASLAGLKVTSELKKFTAGAKDK